jgi:hypothetical protein
MTFATHYSSASRRVNTAKRLNPAVQLLVALLLFANCRAALAETATNTLAQAAARAENIFQVERQAFRGNLTSNGPAWHFARACFDWAEFATNDTQRAEIARQGIKASRELIAHNTRLVHGHYYLGMNLGQLARTKSLGALPLVDEMELEFIAAQKIEERFDFAGPDRNLGLLYLEAPSIGSVGSRSKAKTHLERAAKLAPTYPENRLNLAEARLRWRDSEGARRELEALEAGLAKARELLSGEEWSAAWMDWEKRLQKLRTQLQQKVKPTTSPKGLP